MRIATNPKQLKKTIVSAILDFRIRAVGTSNDTSASQWGAFAVHFCGPPHDQRRPQMMHSAA